MLTDKQLISIHQFCERNDKIQANAAITIMQDIYILRAENERLLDEINSLGNIIIDSAGQGYVSSNDLDRANDAVDMWIEKKGK